jgi:multidrug efflux pump subunit AcrA (membrane-fusion protein)
MTVLRLSTDSPVRYSWLGLLTVLVALAACGIGPAEPAAPTPLPNAPIIAVTLVAPVETPPTEEAASTGPQTGAAGAVAIAAPLAQVSTVYNGEIVARSEVNVVAEVAGTVLEVTVEVGDRVQAGDPLVRIDSARLEAQQASALAGVEALQAQLELATLPPNEADLVAARAAVAAASAAYRRAVDGPTAEDRRLAEAQLRLARTGVTAAQAAYNRVKGDLNIATRPETLQLEQAKLQVQAAQAQIDKLNKGSTRDAIAGAYAQLAQAQAQLKNLQEGAPEEQIQALEAQLDQAETGLFLAQWQLNKATVTAPIAGVVKRISTVPGALAGTGAPLVALLADQVEVTVPVEELRLPTLQVGQPATIRIAAYPDQVYSGTIALIAPQVDPATRTVRVTIRPTEETGDLLPGMFATVELPE